jgi:SIR2-like domain
VTLQVQLGNGGRFCLLGPAFRLGWASQPGNSSLEYIGKELGYDADIFALPDTNYLTLAEYYKLEKGSIGPLRSLMDRHWNIDEVTLAKSHIHRLIVALKFPIIYTTNYDRNLENALALSNIGFTKIVDVRDIVNAGDGKLQLIKLHGDFDNDDSIVITESDYFDR